jgi:hypothetical protein
MRERGKRAASGNLEAECMSDTTTTSGARQGLESTPCSHDIANPERRGRAKYHCRKCMADISMDVVSLAMAEIESENGKNDATRRGICPRCKTDHDLTVHRHCAQCRLDLVRQKYDNWRR